MTSLNNVLHTLMTWNIKILLENKLTADKYRRSTIPDVALAKSSFILCFHIYPQVAIPFS